MKKASRIISVILMCALMLLMTACGGTKFKHGTIGGSTYTSDFLGVKAKFSSEWNLFSDAEMAKYNGITDMSDSSIKSKFKQSGTIYDMMVARSDGASINIVIQDTKVTGKLKEDTYFTTGLEIVKKQFEAMGANVSLKADTTIFCGKSTRCIKLVMSMSGLTMHMIQIPIFKGDYIGNITFGAFDESDLSGFMAMFSAV